MRIGALSLFNKTSSNRTFSLAFWHSPHSLTWRWSLRVSRQTVMFPKPHLLRNTVGFSIGLGQLISLSGYTTNSGGWQIHFAIFWISFQFHKQRPMWYRGLYQRVRDEAGSLRNELGRVNRNADLVAFDRARDVNSEALSRLN